MAIRKLIRYPAVSLRSTCKPVDFATVDKKALSEHLNDLRDTLAATPNGAALASNQIIPQGWRVFAVRPRPGGAEDGNRLPEFVINPEYTPSRTVKPLMLDEGCLSVPELTIQIERALRVALTYQDVNGDKHILVVSGLDAQIVQHECEHLDGKLIIDYADKRTQVRVKQEAIKNRKAGK
jgi:peptide deformylase